jgi:tRNA 2-thiouridine synthesizing protein A
MTKKAVGEIVPGGVVEVLVDNPSSVEALPPMCNELNATHLETIKDPACWRVYIRKD